MKLYEIPYELDKLIDDETGEITDIQLFNSLNEEVEKKLSYIALTNKNRDADIKAIDDEIERLNKRKEKLKKKNANTSAFIYKFMLENGITKIDSPTIRLSFRKSKSVEITDAAKFLEYLKAKNLTELYKVKTTTSFDKKAIKEWLKDNVSPYAEIIEKENLQIK